MNVLISACHCHIEHINSTSLPHCVHTAARLKTLKICFRPSVFILGENLLMRVYFSKHTLSHVTSTVLVLYYSHNESKQQSMQAVIEEEENLAAIQEREAAIKSLEVSITVGKSCITVSNCCITVKI